jgi:hypothetical protein
VAFRNRLWRSVNAARRTSVGAKTSLASDEVGFSATPRSAKEETARTAMPQRAMRASALPTGNPLLDRRLFFASIIWIPRTTGRSVTPKAAPPSARAFRPYLGVVPSHSDGDD